METNEEKEQGFSIHIVNNKTGEIVFNHTLLNFNLTMSQEIEQGFLDNKLIELRKGRFIKFVIQAECVA